MNIELANPISLVLFGLDENRIKQKTLTQLISDHGLHRWLELDDPPDVLRKSVN